MNMIKLPNNWEHECTSPRCNCLVHEKPMYFDTVTQTHSCWEDTCKFAKPASLSSDIWEGYEPWM